MGRSGAKRLLRVNVLVKVEPVAVHGAERFAPDVMLASRRLRGTILRGCYGSLVLLGEKGNRGAVRTLDDVEVLIPRGNRAVRVDRPEALPVIGENRRRRAVARKRHLDAVGRLCGGDGNGMGAHNAERPDLARGTGRSG